MNYTEKQQIIETALEQIEKDYSDTERLSITFNDVQTYAEEARVSLGIDGNNPSKADMEHTGYVIQHYAQKPSVIEPS